MLSKPKFEIIQSRPVRPVYDPKDPHLIGAPVYEPYGYPVGFAPEDTLQPYGLEVSIVLRHGESELPLIRELIDKLNEIAQVLDDEARGN